MKLWTEQVGGRHVFLLGYLSTFWKQQMGSNSEGKKWFKKRNNTTSKRRSDPDLSNFQTDSALSLISQGISHLYLCLVETSKSDTADSLLPFDEETAISEEKAGLRINPSGQNKYMNEVQGTHKIY